MRVLVTGSRGYLGSILIPRLREAGHVVVGLDTDLYRACTYAGSIPDMPTLHKDVRDAVSRDLADAEAIIHLAGLSNDPLGDLRPEITEEINHLATINLAHLAKAAGIHHFVFASSCSVYGAAGSEWIDESAPYNPVTPYAVSKMASELALSALAGPEFCPVHLRASTVYGVSPRLRFDLVVNNLTAHAMASGQVYLKSDGSAWRPLVHVDDVASAFIAALEAPSEAVRGRAFNIGRTDENFRVSEIAEMVRQIVPGSRIEYSAEASPDQRSYRVNCDRIVQALPNYQPRWTVRDGIEQLYMLYRERNLRVEDFEGARFARVAHLKNLQLTGQLDARLRWISETVLT